MNPSLQEIEDIISSAEQRILFNSINFDIKYINYIFLIHKMVKH
jgi:hypothetical protein